MVCTLAKESSSIVSFHKRCVTAGAWAEYANGPFLQVKNILVSKLQDPKGRYSNKHGDEILTA